MSGFLLHFVAAALGTVAFALIFDVPAKYFPLCALIGGSGFFLSEYLATLDLSVTEATFFATALVMLTSRFAAVFMRCPVTVFLVAGIIPLVPGAGIYWTAYYLVMGDTSLALSNGFAAIRAAVAIVLGIVLVFELPNKLFLIAGRRGGK